MRPDRSTSYGAPMRLVIDFDSTAGRWSGAVLPEPGPDVAAVPFPFSGRLDLLRLLESLVDDASTHPTAPAKDPS